VESQRPTGDRGGGGRKHNSGPFLSQFYPPNSRFIYCLEKEGERKSGVIKEKTRKGK